MSDFKVFVSELSSIDALSTCTIELGEISTLSHEIGNDSMEHTVQKGEILA